MPPLQTSQFGMPAKSMLGLPNGAGAFSGIAGELLISEFLPRWSNLVKTGRVFSAYATVTAPVAFSTAAGIGGPLLWNKPTSGLDAHIIAIGLSTTVVTTVAGGIGITGNNGQTAAPTTTTAIDGSGNMLIGGPSSGLNAYRIGTVAVAGAQFTPFAQVHTGALTVDTTGFVWAPVDGMAIVPPGSWGSVAASVLLSTLVSQICLIWAELPA